MRIKRYRTRCGVTLSLAAMTLSGFLSCAQGQSKLPPKAIPTPKATPKPIAKVTPNKATPNKATVAPKTEKTDMPFEGKYQWVSSLYVGTVKVVKEGEFYRLELTNLAGEPSKLYRSYRFVRKSATCLEDEKGQMGRIYWGHMNFDDTPDKPVVLQVRFKYEWAVLVNRIEEPMPQVMYSGKIKPPKY